MVSYVTCLRNDHIYGLHGQGVEGHGKRNNGRIIRRRYIFLILFCHIILRSSRGLYPSIHKGRYCRRQHIDLTFFAA